MKIEVAAPVFKVELSWEEARFLYRLIGFHVSGDGVNRDISNNIYDALGEFSTLYFPACKPLPTLDYHQKSGIIRLIKE